MKKSNKLIMGAALLTAMSALASCQGKHYDVTITVYNWEDYIYDGTEDGKKVEDSTIQAFQKYYEEKTGLSINVKYKTFSTCEDMYTKISRGLIKADLCCPSDYMIQRMQREGMLESFGYNTSTKEYGEELTNVNEFTSPYIKKLFDDNSFSDYAVPYFWGTMGFTYNMDTVDSELLTSWDAEWNTAFRKRLSIKDSMRDTYFTAVMHVYKSELLSLKDRYESEAITAEEYNKQLSEIFNRCDTETLNKCKTALQELTSNVVLEVDEGKNDIVLGNIDVNLAWSGDAVFSMDEADEGERITLGYIIPDEGSNVWFDGWCMPKGANVEASKEFLNFLADPEVAAKNMNYTGYTSPIAGQAIWEMVNEWYSIDAYDEYEASDCDEIDLSYFFEGTLEEGEVATILVPKDERGRQFDAQYPTEETIVRCAIMRDFGEEATEALNNMWIDFRSSF